MSQLKQTAKHSAIYAIGSMISRITALVMLPIYTRYLTPADYGVLELLSMAIDLTGILVGMRISQAMFRYYILSEDDRERQSIVSTVLFTACIASTTGAMILYLASAPISELIFGSDQYLYEFQLFAFTLIPNALSAVGLSYIRARRKPVLFVIVGVLTLTLQVTFNVIFVVILEMHVRGVVYGALLSGAIIASALSIYVLLYSGINFSKQIAVRIFNYISPLILASLGAFYVAYADKYFIRIFSSLTDVGLYALAARIGSVLTTVTQAFNMSWNADRFEIVKKDNAKELFAKVFKYLNIAIVLVAAGLSIFAKDFFWIMTDPAFYPAGGVVPLLMLALVLNIYTMFCNFGVLLKEKTRHIAEGAWLKTIIATLGYILLIPALGIYGAALTLIAANLIELIWINNKARQLYDMGLEWRYVGYMLTVAVMSVGAAISLPYGELLYFICRVLIYLLLVVMMLFIPIWEDGERSMIRVALFGFMKRNQQKA